MANFTLYTNKLSRGRIVHWMLEELGEPYDVQLIEYGAQMKSGEYLKINPMGKVPALKHGETIITETAAILTYLADAYPEKGLIPPHQSAARASFFRWMFFIAGPLEMASSVAILGWVPPERTSWGTPATGLLGYGTLDLTLHTIEMHLKQNRYICGDQFTAADIYLSSHLVHDIVVGKAYESRPVFDDYIHRMHARPAKKRAELA